MRRLNDREKRTIRLAAIGLGGYLALFYGYQGFQRLEERRAAYEAARVEASMLKNEAERRKIQVLRLEKLRLAMGIDPSKLRPETLVSGASAAIQGEAQTDGLQLGPFREMPARSTGKELAVIQVEGQGPVGGAMQFLRRLPRLGFPLVVETVQMRTAGLQPGLVQVSASVSVLSGPPVRGGSAAPAASPDGPGTPPASRRIDG